jgi:hypothetical protein
MGSPRRLGSSLGLQAREIEACSRERNWATTEEIAEACYRDGEQRGLEREPYVYLIEKVEATYSAVRRWYAIGSQGAINLRQLARDLYPEVGNDYAAYLRKRNSIRNHLDLLIRQGLLTKEVLAGEGGKTEGLQINMLPIPEEISRLERVRRSSSVG